MNHIISSLTAGMFPQDPADSVGSKTLTVPSDSAIAN